MSALAGARAAFVATVSAALPGVTVSPIPLGEDEPLAESVYVAGTSSEFDWRCIGPRRTNRSEDVALEVVVQVFRHHDDQRQAGAQALARADELLEAVELAVADGLDLDGTVTHARVSRWSVDPRARSDGWSVVGTLRVEAQNFPTL